MRCKKACLVINPRDGENLAKITHIMSILAAAGWSTDIAIKEYPGHTMELATKAAKKNYDLVIAYGGDGTLNQVVNGTMNGKRSIVGTIPGGTVNEWAAEVTIPNDPVKATLALINSDARKVDVGHVEVAGLTFPSVPQVSPRDDDATAKKTVHNKKSRGTPTAKHHFLLMAGLGIDAAIMGHVNKSLKHRIGVAAVGLTVAKELPEQRSFPVEIRAVGGDAGADMLWRGEALQIVIGNTRRYADMVEMTPDAYVDDGVLDVCVITAGTPLTTLQQISTLLLRRKPDNLTTEYFRGAHLMICVPASVPFHLDGSAEKLKDYLSKAERKALEELHDPDHVMVNYRFDALPLALRAAIPRTYNDVLFEASHSAENPEGKPQDSGHSTSVEGEAERGATADSTVSGPNEDRTNNRSAEETAQPTGPQTEEGRKELQDLIETMLHQGRKVTVVAVGPNPAKPGTYIVAGRTPKRMTGEVTPVAVRLDEHTVMITRTGEHVSPAIVEKVPEGTEIVVEGKKSKRGVIQATRALLDV